VRRLVERAGAPFRMVLRLVGQLRVQLTFATGTWPSAVRELKVQSTGNTSAPAGRTLILALVRARSLMSPVHLRLGQSGAPGIGVTGPW
jgi:hypothetical protein